MASDNTHPIPNVPISVPQHSFFTSPTGPNTGANRKPELPLHLVALILSYVCPGIPSLPISTHDLIAQLTRHLA